VAGAEAAAFFVTAFLTGATFFAAFAGGALTAVFLVAVFWAAAFLFAACSAFAASARFAALAARAFARFATIAALPALLSFRLGFLDFGVAGAGGSDSPRIFAHLAFCAIAIFRLEAALN